MKTKSLLTAILAIVLFINAKAITRTVNNNFASPGQYSSVTAAITAASNGDTILIHASPVNYNSFVVNKQLVFFGSGHNPQTTNANRSYMQTIQLTTGSNGSQFYGLDVDYFQAIAGNISNIKIVRCKINGRIYNNGQPTNNWTVESNVFVTSATNIDLQTSTNSNWYVKNNIFNGMLDGFYTGNTNIYFINNIFLRNGTAFNYYVANISFFNNIFYRANPNGGGFDGYNSFDKNVSYQCGNNAFNNGTNYVNVNPQFTNFPGAGAYFDYAYDFTIQNGSPVKNGGNDGTDPGVYGGSVTFNQNGIPAIPYVKTLTITGSNTVPANGTLNISVKSKVVQ